MKKFIFCCLVVLISSCKDKEESPSADFSTEFVGDYWTNTIEGTTTAAHTWDVTAMAKNKLGIVYQKHITGTASGAPVDITQKYALANVNATSKDSFTIDEEVDVEQTGIATFKQKVQGVATKVLNTAGVPQINITLKITNSTSGVSSEEYLEFKKK